MAAKHSLNNKCTKCGVLLSQFLCRSIVPEVPQGKDALDEEAKIAGVQA